MMTPEHAPKNSAPLVNSLINLAIIVIVASLPLRCLTFAHRREKYALHVYRNVIHYIHLTASGSTQLIKYLIGNLYIYIGWNFVTHNVCMCVLCELYRSYGNIGKKKALLSSARMRHMPLCPSQAHDISLRLPISRRCSAETANELSWRSLIKLAGIFVRNISLHIFFSVAVAFASLLLSGVVETPFDVNEIRNILIVCLDTVVINIANMSINNIVIACAVGLCRTVSRTRWWLARPRLSAFNFNLHLHVLRRQ